MHTDWLDVHQRVIYGDTDAMGIVYYGNYFRFLERARSELMRHLGVPYRGIEERGFLIPVAEVGLKYLRPARYDDEIVIKIRVERLTGASIRFEYRLERPDAAGEGEPELLGTGFSRHAVIEAASGRVVRIPEDLVEVLGGRKE